MYNLSQQVISGGAPIADADPGSARIPLRALLGLPTGRTGHPPGQLASLLRATPGREFKQGQRAVPHVQVRNHTLHMHKFSSGGDGHDISVIFQRLSHRELWHDRCFILGCGWGRLHPLHAKGVTTTERSMTS